MKIALVHDALCVMGGAEKFILWLKEAFPLAPIFTSVYLPERTFPEFKDCDVRTLPFSRFVKSETQMKLMYPIWYLGFRNLDLSEYDIVLSTSTYLAKFINPPSHVKHIAYIHAPFRLLWKPELYTTKNKSWFKYLAYIIRPLIPLLVKWDRRQTRKINTILANSKNMANAIWDAYQKPSTVIYPPIDPDEFSISDQPGDYYISVSRLVSHKRVDIAVEACTILNRNLVVVGDGPELSGLKKIAGPSIRFVGKVQVEELIELYKHSKALLFPSEEDYGLVPLEAQACGIPVIAYGKGGILETVLERKTGIFFEEQTSEALLNAIQEFESLNFDQKMIRGWVEKFKPETFIEKIHEFVQNA